MYQRVHTCLRIRLCVCIHVCICSAAFALPGAPSCGLRCPGRIRLYVCIYVCIHVLPCPLLRVAVPGVPGSGWGANCARWESASMPRWKEGEGRGQEGMVRAGKKERKKKKGLVTGSSLSVTPRRKAAICCSSTGCLQVTWYTLVFNCFGDVMRCANLPSSVSNSRPVVSTSRRPTLCTPLRDAKTRTPCQAQDPACRQGSPWGEAGAETAAAAAAAALTAPGRGGAGGP